MVSIDGVVVYYVKVVRGFVRDGPLPRIDTRPPATNERLEDIVLVALPSHVALAERQLAFDRALFGAGERPDVPARVRALRTQCETYGVPLDILYMRLKESRPTAQCSTEWDRLSQVPRPSARNSSSTAATRQSLQQGGSRGKGFTFLPPTPTPRRARRS
jgi:hypothetical protein